MGGGNLHRASFQEAGCSKSVSEGAEIAAGKGGKVKIELCSTLIGYFVVLRSLF